jgi:hypothetical protein
MDMSIELRNRICDAIKNKQRIKFEYNKKMRVGEPQCCGKTTKEKDVVRLHLIPGGSKPVQLFDISEIGYLQLLDEYFSGPGPNYRKDDSAMKSIYCQL